MSANEPGEADDRVADFGYEQVPWGEKKARVRGVFDSVASRYEIGRASCRERVSLNV